MRNYDTSEVAKQRNIVSKAVPSYDELRRHVMRGTRIWVVLSDGANVKQRIAKDHKMRYN